MTTGDELSATSQVRLELPTSLVEEFRGLADEHRLECEDLMAWVLGKHAADAPGPSEEPSVFWDHCWTMLKAEVELKAEVGRVLDRLTRDGIPEDITLRVFQRIREDHHLRALYFTATDTRAEQEHSPSRARVNRALGAFIMKRCRARPRMQGPARLVVQVEGELIRSYSLLEAVRRWSGS